MQEQASNLRSLAGLKPTPERLATMTAALDGNRWPCGAWKMERRRIGRSTARIPEPRWLNLMRQRLAIHSLLLFPARLRDARGCGQEERCDALPLALLLKRWAGNLPPP